MINYFLPLHLYNGQEVLIALNQVVQMQPVKVSVYDDSDKTGKSVTHLRTELTLADARRVIVREQYKEIKAKLSNCQGLHIVSPFPYTGPTIVNEINQQQ